MIESNINIKVLLDAEKVPQKISWNATGSTAEEPQSAKAMCVAFWDSIDKSALRIDLWTKDMMVDEMADFYHQVFVTMGDTFLRATQNAELSNDIKVFARQFHDKFVKMEKEKQS
ncbi:MAG: gliding motility protein GldC [Ginsengibacter sp.]|jgi:gliding motility-associated protein GldC